MPADRAPAGPLWNAVPQPDWNAVPELSSWNGVPGMCQDVRMPTRTRRPERREEPLSRERVVEAAIELLDTAGEGGLTFRALAARLATGPGAIYWHVTGKDELLGAATDAVL